MKRKIQVMAAILFSSHLSAQSDSSRLLNEVVVTAHKFERKQAETGKVVTVIGREQLEQSTGRNIGDVLNTTVGTTILGSNNSPGTNFTASVRGASAGNTLILLDGVPVSDPSANNNYFDLNFISIDQIERIEILKGGQSTLYGSDAVAGVINIITRKATQAGTNFKASVAGGSYNTFKQDIGMNGRKGKLNYSVGYTHLSTKGFSAATDETGGNNFDKDGSNQHAAQMQLGYQLNPALRFTLMGRYNHYNADIDASGFNDERDFTVRNRQAQTGAGLQWKHKNGQLRFNYNFNYIDRQYIDDSIHQDVAGVVYSNSLYIGRSHFAEVYHQWNFKHGELLTGFDYRTHNTYQYYYSESVWGPYEAGPWRAKLDQYSPYASLMLRTATGLILELGGRLNIHSEYGTNFTFNFNPSYRLNERTQAFANLYTAFKAPTLYQLFDPFSGYPDLDPEKSTVTEAGINVTPANGLDLRLVGYWRGSDNTIQYLNSDGSTPIYQYRNIARQENYGIELEASYQAGKWKLGGNYAYTDGKTRSAYDGTGAGLGKDTTYFNLFRIPKHALNLQLGYAFTEKIFVNLQSRTLGDREEFVYGSSPEVLKGYTVLDLYGEYKLDKNFKFFLDLRNITDTKYVEWKGFNTRRFNFMAGVTVKW